MRGICEQVLLGFATIHSFQYPWLQQEPIPRSYCMLFDIAWSEKLTVERGDKDLSDKDLLCIQKGPC